MPPFADEVQSDALIASAPTHISDTEIRLGFLPHCHIDIYDENFTNTTSKTKQITKYLLTTLISRSSNFLY